MISILIISTLLLAIAVGLSAADPEPQNISIGALVDLTGDWSTQGEDSWAALEVAVADINSFLKEIGSTKQVSLEAIDTGSDPAKAMEGLENLSQSGINMVIADVTSSELAAMKDYADAHGLVLIGTSSTAPSLAIPGDSIVRLVPDDSNQARAISGVIELENITAVVPIARQDVWGDDLLNATTRSFEARGGKVLKGVRYLPGTNFSSEVKALQAQVSEALEIYRPDEMGIYLISFDEAAPLLTLASRSPELSSVRWFGSDGLAGSKNIIEDPEVARFVAERGLICPVYSAYSEYDDYRRVYDAVREETGSEPVSYAMVSYDALWATAEAMILSGSSNSTQLKAALIRFADNYRGVTGSLSLNEAGDRRSARYRFMAVKEADGGHSWSDAGGYSVRGQYEAVLELDGVTKIISAAPQR